MKKIPTVFKRVYEGHKIVDILDEFTNEKCKDAFLHGKSIEYLEPNDEIVNTRPIIEADSITESSVKKQKTGKWIRHDTGHSVYYDCSLCSCCAPCTETADKILWKLSNFCPDCGAKMETK